MVVMKLMNLAFHSAPMSVLETPQIQFSFLILFKRILINMLIFVNMQSGVLFTKGNTLFEK